MLRLTCVNLTQYDLASSFLRDRRGSVGPEQTSYAGDLGERCAQKTARPSRVGLQCGFNRSVFFRHPWPQHQPQAEPMLRLRSKVQSGGRPPAGRGLQLGKRRTRTLPTPLMSRKRTLLGALVVLKAVKFSSRRFRRGIANISDGTQ